MRIEIGRRDSRYINAHICYFSLKIRKKRKIQMTRIRIE